MMNFKETNSFKPTLINKNKSKKLFLIINFILLLTLILLMGLNQVVIAKTYKVLGLQGRVWKQINKLVGGMNSATTDGVELSGDITQDAIKLVISSGIPNIYGSELGVSFDFDKVQDSMNVLSQFDPTYGQKKITLAGDNLKRYVDIGLKISCEYCCGAKSIIFQDGQAACGCAHSQAMRGLAAYLIQNHGQEYSNDEILRELARWKGMYFPKQMIQKLTSQFQNGNYTPDIAALILGLKLPNYGQGSKSAPLPSDVENLPSMVGGC